MSEQELRQLLRASHAGGVVTATEAQIIHKAFEFADQTAADLMIPTQSVAYLSLSRSVEGTSPSPCTPSTPGCLCARTISSR